MYITGTGLIDKSQLKKKATKTGASGFSELLSDSEIEEVQTSPTTSINSANQLLFMQEVDDKESLRREAVNHAFDAIKYLDTIKMGLLTGALSKDMLLNLEASLQRMKRNFNDPHLSEIIDEIELRAKVEIAKLER